MSKGKAAKSLTMKVMLDTSVLYTGAAHYLLRREVSELIRDKSPSLEIEWYVASTTRDERHFQMVSAANRLLPHLAKVEKLLGHHLNIHEELLAERVAAAIAAQAQAHDLAIKNFDPALIDWHRLSQDAAFRRAPFEEGEKEKGFRDALIVETFAQLVSESPSTPGAARLVLVANDQLLRDATASRLAKSSNVHILASIDELKALINTLSSKVDEDFVALIQPKAEAFFYSRRSGTDGFYHKASVQASLERELAESSFPLPPGAVAYNATQWRVHPPRFEHKEGQRIFWVSRFEASLHASQPSAATTYAGQSTNLINPSFQAPHVTGVQFTPPAGSTYTQLSGFAVNTPDSYFGTGDLTRAPQGLLSYSTSPKDATGVASLDVLWSATITTAGVLSKAKLEKVRFVDVEWD